MINWIKPNGNKITTNDMAATVAYCESLNWKREVKRKRKVKTDGDSSTSNKGDTARDFSQGV